MKESVLDILIYLFENYFDGELDEGFEPDRETLKQELEHAGFAARDVERALGWLEELATSPVRAELGSTARAIRIFDALRAGASRHGLSRLSRASRADRHPVADAARAGHRPADGARRRRDRHRKAEMGRTDGAIQSAGTGNSLLAGWKIWCSKTARAPSIERVPCRDGPRRRGHPRFNFFRATNFLMTRNLVIVESPAKAKTIKKYLGKDYEVMASYGHVRDLVPKEGAVDPTRNFAMRWEIIDKNRKHVDAIARALQEGRRAVPVDRPRSRGRGDLLAPVRAAQGGRRARRQERAPQRVLRDHASNAVQEAVDQPREIAAGARQGVSRASRARLPRRFQSLAAAVEEGRAVRRLGGPRAESGAAHDLRARGRDCARSSRASTGRSTPRPKRPRRQASRRSDSRHV